MCILVRILSFRQAQWADLVKNYETPSRKEPQWKVHRKGRESAENSNFGILRQSRAQ